MVELGERVFYIYMITHDKSGRCWEHLETVSRYRVQSGDLRPSPRAHQRSYTVQQSVARRITNHRCSLFTDPPFSSPNPNIKRTRRINAGQQILSSSPHHHSTTNHHHSTTDHHQSLSVDHHHPTNHHRPPASPCFSSPDDSQIQMTHHQSLSADHQHHHHQSANIDLPRTIVARS